MIDINGINGYGTAQDLPDLFKALQSGYNFGVTDQTGGGALRVESLESSLKVLTYTEQNVRFWKNVPKMPAYNTVEEYNLLTDYGDLANAFVPEGVLPETEDSVYSRKVALIKFLGTTRVVTHPMTLVRAAHGDVISLENRNGILWLMRKIEQALFWGNNTLAFNYASSSGGVEGIEWSGLDGQIDSNSFIDAKGGSLTEGILEDACELIAENFGQATEIYCPYKVASDFSKTFYPKERALLPTPQGGYAAGSVINTFASQFGPIQIQADVFLNKNRKALGLAPSAATSPNAPQVPASSAAGAPTGTDGVWKISQAVFYKSTAVNRFGESAATAATSTQTPTLAQHVVVTVANPAAMGGLLPDYFNIYRSDDGGTNYFYIASVPAASQSANGTTTYTDTGLYMTNVSTAFILEMAPHVLAMKQLAPLMKMDLAVLGPAIRWMILFYATFVLYTPKKAVKIINIGDLS